MTFSLRTLSGRRYRVQGDLPSVHDPEFARRLLDRRFRDLSPSEERAVGWVTADNCLDTEFTAEAVARGPCAVFALRIDRRRVDSRLLRARLDLEWRGRRKDAEASAEGSGPPERGSRKRRTGREERLELRRSIAEEMLRRATPATEVHPVLLYARDRVVCLRSLSRSANEAFRALFVDTFGATLAALTPYHRGLELLSDRNASEALGALRATSFARGHAPEAVPAAVPGWRRSVAPAGEPVLPEAFLSSENLSSENLSSESLSSEEAS